MSNESQNPEMTENEILESINSYFNNKHIRLLPAAVEGLAQWLWHYFSPCKCGHPHKSHYFGDRTMNTPCQLCDCRDFTAGYRLSPELTAISDEEMFKAYKKGEAPPAPNKYKSLSLEIEEKHNNGLRAVVEAQLAHDRSTIQEQKK